MKFSAVD